MGKKVKLTVLSYEFKHYLNEYLANSVTGEQLSLSKIIEYNNQHSSTELKLYGQGLLIQANESKTLDDPVYIQSRDENLKAARDAIDNILAQNKLDVLLAPADFRLGSFSPPAVAGYPVITIPLDVNTNKIPFGITLHTKGDKDVMLLKVAKLVSDSIKVQRPTPKFIPCCNAINSYQNNWIRLADTFDSNQRPIELQSDSPNVLKEYANPIDLSIIPPKTHDTSTTSCVFNLMTHGFANSYGKPYIGNYTLPACLTQDKQIDQIIMKFVGNVKGRQFDRFGAVYLDGYELLRTTTAEPTEKGIQWNFEKDLSDKIPLFYNERVVTASIGNLVNEIYTGTIYIKIDIVFYLKNKSIMEVENEGESTTVNGENVNDINTNDINTIISQINNDSDSIITNEDVENILNKYNNNNNNNKYSDNDSDNDNDNDNIIHEIISISKGKGQEAWYTINNNQSLIVDINNDNNNNEIVGAELEIFISNHGCDEFWYLNPSNDYALQHGECSNGGYRELQIFLNDQFISNLIPFPTVYTGGITLTLWRPISGLGSFDVPTYRLDLLPFLPLLSNNKLNNKLRFNVVNATEFWLVSGNLHLFKKKNKDTKLITLIPPELKQDIEFSYLNDLEQFHFNIQMKQKNEYNTVYFHLSNNKLQLNIINYNQQLQYQQNLLLKDNLTTSDYLIYYKNQIQLQHLKFNDISINQLNNFNKLNLIPIRKVYELNDHYLLNGKLTQLTTKLNGYNLSSIFNLSSYKKDIKNNQIHLSLSATAYAIRDSLTSSAIGDCNSTASIKAILPTYNPTYCYQRKLTSNHGFYIKDEINFNC
ncbi:hypothetical protein K502DRAFT_369107 [Neoconidiobolus thromboides FSU 785]|nr:hypothetical protein K502DRAFT_369107 [Neoconidiobolus thromboides FSU 785]